ncbi:hypothetical protein C8Q74DRAFT_1373076 [Fomes fomentarius]|nr:hypothetical protein C8Q74DRAFT_1373076 [Fomes fomentarius]
MASLTLIDDDDSSVLYSPLNSWIFDQLPQAVDGTRHGAIQDGSSVSVKFRGTGVDVVNTIEPAIGPSQRHMLYVIDGLLVGNQSAPCENTGETDLNVTVFSIRDLTLGNHELTITTLKSGSPTAFWLDYFLIYSDPPLAEETLCSTTIAPTRTTNPTPLSPEGSIPSSPSLLPSSSILLLPHSVEPIKTSLVSVEPYLDGPAQTISGLTTATAALIPLYHLEGSPKPVAGGSQANSTTSSATPEPSKAHRNVALIVGGVLGGVVLFLLILVIVLVVRRRWKNASTDIEKWSFVKDTRPVYTPSDLSRSASFSTLSAKSYIDTNDAYATLHDSALSRRMQTDGASSYRTAYTQSLGTCNAI